MSCHEYWQLSDNEDLLWWMQITPPSRPIADWDAVVERQSYWTLHEAYHNLVPANASKGTWPLSPVDKQFEYIRALTLAHAWL